jgi:hypothetical protein
MLLFGMKIERRRTVKWMLCEITRKEILSSQMPIVERLNLIKKRFLTQ